MKIPLDMVRNSKFSGGIIDTDQLGKLLVHYDEDFSVRVRALLRKAKRDGKLNFVDEEWSLKEE